MNLYNECSKNEIKLLENIGLEIENKDYTSEELSQYEHQITDHIMSQSTKNGDITKLMDQYNGILNTLVKGM